MYALKDTIGSSDADIHIYYGGRETGEIKRSAERIGKLLPAGRVHCLRDFRHGDLSINHARDYAEIVRRMTGGRE